MTNSSLYLPWLVRLQISWVLFLATHGSFLIKWVLNTVIVLWFGLERSLYILVDDVDIDIVVLFGIATDIYVEIVASNSSFDSCCCLYILSLIKVFHTGLTLLHNMGRKRLRILKFDFTLAQSKLRSHWVSSSCALSLILHVPRISLSFISRNIWRLLSILKRFPDDLRLKTWLLSMKIIYPFRRHIHWFFGLRISSLREVIWFIALLRRSFLLSVLLESRLDINVDTIHIVH